MDSNYERIGGRKKKPEFELKKKEKGRLETFDTTLYDLFFAEWEEL